MFVLIFVAACGENDESGDNVETEDSDSLYEEEATDETGDVSGRDDIIIGLDAEIPTLDLHATNTLIAAQIMSNVFETLIVQDEQMNLHPGLATSWELLEDGRTWEFHLLEGVYFHNGQPLTAADVAFTMARAAGSPHMAPFLGMIDPDTILVVDDHTVQIGTEFPFAPFLSHLAHNAAGIMSEYKVVELDWLEAPDHVGGHPVGTGPFQFVSWTVGEQVILQRFEDYHGQIEQIGTPRIREITFRIIPDAFARDTELLTGGIDVDIEPLSDNFERLLTDDITDLRQAPALRTSYIGMNTEHPVLSDYRVRQAINYAVDMESIHGSILNNNGVIAHSPIASTVFGHHAGLAPYPFDTERASDLLAEAGFEEGFEIDLLIGSDALEDRSVVEAVANQLGAIGISVNIRQYEWPTFLEFVFDAEADLFMIGWTTVTGDADYGLFPLFHSSNFGASGNLSLFVNERVDELLEAARETIVDAERIAYYTEVQEILHEEAPWLLLHQPDETLGVRADVQGFEVSPTGVQYFGNVYFLE